MNSTPPFLQIKKPEKPWI